MQCPQLQVVSRQQLRSLRPSRRDGQHVELSTCLPNLGCRCPGRMAVGHVTYDLRVNAIPATLAKARWQGSEMTSCPPHTIVQVLSYECVKKGEEG
jgi:hypothetical protein